MKDESKTMLKYIDCSKNCFNFFKKNENKFQYKMQNYYSQITEQNYWYMLCCMPPLHMHGKAFLMSELNSGNLTNGAIEIAGKYYVFVIAVKDFKKTIIELLQRHEGDK